MLIEHWGVYYHHCKTNSQVSDLSAALSNFIPSITNKPGPECDQMERLMVINSHIAIRKLGDQCKNSKDLSPL